MYHMYQLDAFTQSCPADQDIINHYKLQQVNKKTKTKTSRFSISNFVSHDLYLIYSLRVIIRYEKNCVVVYIKFN